MTIFMSGLDSLEATFATRVLDFSESTYGFLVSIAGLGIIAGSVINATCTKWLSLRFLIGFGAIATPVGYLIFATATDFCHRSNRLFPADVCVIVREYRVLVVLSKQCPRFDHGTILRRHQRRRVDLDHRTDVIDRSARRNVFDPLDLYRLLARLFTDRSRLITHRL